MFGATCDGDWQIAVKSGRQAVTAAAEVPASGASPSTVPARLNQLLFSKMIEVLLPKGSATGGNPGISGDVWRSMFADAVAQKAAVSLSKGGISTRRLCPMVCEVDT
jgi:hypothetical protein